MSELTKAFEEFCVTIEKKWKWLLRYYPERSPMFEYDVVEVAKWNPEKIADKLNKLGDDGWEVCAVYESSSSPKGAWLGVIVKRPKPTKTPETTGKCMCHVGLPGYVCEYCRSLGYDSLSEKI